MACHRIPKQEAMDLKPSDITRTVSDMALITKAVDKPLSQYMTAGYLELKPGYDRELSTEYEEVNLFLEGSLTYSFGGERFTAQKGDVVRSNRAAGSIILRKKAVWFFMPSLRS